MKAIQNIMIDMLHQLLHLQALARSIDPQGSIFVQGLQEGNLELTFSSSSLALDVDGPSIAPFHGWNYFNGKARRQTRR